MRKILVGVYRFLCHMSLDLFAAFVFLQRYPKYLSDIKRYRGMMTEESSAQWGFSLWPILSDRDKQAAELGEYFWQDLYIARRIVQDNPLRHIDVGSRIDGFVAHLACTRSVEVLDIRPPPAIIPNVNFIQHDLLNVSHSSIGQADCVSCLHTLEHIGLGRYGDSIDPEGWRKGLKSLVWMVKGGGNLWLSVPVGRQRIEFNAHRVFAPKTIELEARRNGLETVEFHYFKDGELCRSNSMVEDMHQLAGIEYSLSLFLFKKIEL